ncbi:MAG: phage scaffolding protein [Tissierellales bacterium]
MEWIKQLIEKHTKDGVLNQEELIKDINKEFPKYAVPKDQYNAVAEAKKKLEKDIAERDKQLEDLKKIDADGLKAEIERLQQENKVAKEKYEAELKNLQLTNAIKLALNGKVYDEDIVTQLINKDKLVLNEDGKVIGLDEQINSLKESKAFLFLPEKQDNQPIGFQKVGNEPSNNQQAIDDAIAAAFGNLQQK